MAFPPPVSADDATAAVERIVQRRRQIDDQNLWRLGDSPAEALSYLQRYSSGVPRAVAEADVLDGLVLKVRLWWLAEQSEWWLLERAKELGIGPSRIGRLVGVRSRQGVHDRLQLARRKMSRLQGQPVSQRYDNPTEQALDAARRRWLTRHRAQVRDIARHAVTFRDVTDDDTAEWLIDVARDLADGAVTPGSLQLLRFALLELADDKACEHAGRGDERTELLSRWLTLYATYPPTAEDDPQQD